MIYTWYSKNPPIPARIVCKRSYKDFNKESFLKDIAALDWSEVYGCEDVDLAAETFAQKFRFVLNTHAPWVKVQQRKRFTPWITEETKNLIKLRDNWKKVAKDLSVEKGTSCEAQADAWKQYRKYRNQINNRKKHEEENYKTEKLIEVTDSPE